MAVTGPITNICFAPAVQRVDVVDGWVCGVQHVALPADWLQGGAPVLMAVRRVLPTATRAADRRVLEKLQRTSGLLSWDSREAFEWFGKQIVDPEVARAFFLRYGVFDLPHFRGRRVRVFDPKGKEFVFRSLPRAVSEWRRRAASGAGPERVFIYSLDQLRWEQERLRALVKIYSRLMDRDREQARHVAESIGRGSEETAMEQEIMARVRDVMLSLIFTGDGSPRPCLVSLYVLPSLYAHLWNRFVSGTHLRACGRCDKVFEHGRSNKVFCSLRCQEAAKQRRARARRSGGAQRA